MSYPCAKCGEPVDVAGSRCARCNATNRIIDKLDVLTRAVCAEIARRYMERVMQPKFSYEIDGVGTYTLHAGGVSFRPDTARADNALEHSSAQARAQFLLNLDHIIDTWMTASAKFLDETAAAIAAGEESLTRLQRGRP